MAVFCQCEKQKLVECLRGPASGIVRFVKIGNPSATSGDYLSVLETVFGNTESASNLKVRFKGTFQEGGKTLCVHNKASQIATCSALQKWN